MLFRPDGQWFETTDRLGKTTSGTYSADLLVEVSLPDDRSFDLTYHASGRLESITEVGVDETTTRSWSYQWAAHQLAGITMPDGRAWEFEYSASLLPLMTRQRLVAPGGSAVRVERAWEYGRLASPSRPRLSVVVEVSVVALAHDPRAHARRPAILVPAHRRAAGSSPRS